MTRNRSLDIAKGIAICLMVLGHSFSQDNAVLWVINSFHMPFFFIVSGVLYADKFQSGVNFHIGKMMLKLLVPYAVFELLFCTYLAAFNTAEPFATVLKEHLYYTITLRGNNATWFLSCMFVTEVLFFCVLKFIKNKMICITLFSVMFLTGLLTDFAWMPEVIDRLMTYIGFLAIGYYAKELLCRKAKWFITAPLTIIFISLAIMKNVMNVPFIPVVFGIMTGILGSYLLLQFSVFFNDSIYRGFLSFSARTH